MQRRTLATWSDVMTTGMRRLFDANLAMWLMVTGVTITDPSKAQYVAWPCVMLAAFAQHWAFYRCRRDRAAAAARPVV